MISEEQKKELKAKLEQELDVLEKELDSFTKELSSSPGGHETFVDNPEETSQEDEAQISEEYSRKKALETVMEKRLEEIRAALKQIDSPNYGKCVKCRKTIPGERLQVNPAATTCIQCAK
jgi:DnaK suppressor protein